MRVRIDGRNAIRAGIMAFDRSESTDAFRAQKLHAITIASDVAMANNAEEQIWCYATSDKQVFTPKGPQGLNAITAVKQEEMLEDPAHPRRRTRPAVLLDDIAKGISKDGAPGDVRIALLTDGDNDYGADSARIKQDLKALSLHPGPIGLISR